MSLSPDLQSSSTTNSSSSTVSPTASSPSSQKKPSEPHNSIYSATSWGLMSVLVLAGLVTIVVLVSTLHWYLRRRRARKHEAANNRPHHLEEAPTKVVTGGGQRPQLHLWTPGASNLPHPTMPVYSHPTHKSGAIGAIAQSQEREGPR